MSRTSKPHGVRCSDGSGDPPRVVLPRSAAKRVLLAALFAIAAGSDANTSTCLVKQWNFVFGQQTTARMAASSGAICQTYLDAPGGVRSIRIVAPPRNGTATALGRGL